MENKIPSESDLTPSLVLMTNLVDIKVDGDGCLRDHKFVANDVTVTDEPCPLVNTGGSGDRPPLTGEGVEETTLAKRVRQSAEYDTLDNKARSRRLSLINIYRNVQNLKENMEGTMCGLKTLEVLFRCEACQETPMSSQTIFTCDLSHQVCGNCHIDGVTTCVVCKGHLSGENVPLEDVLRRLRQNYSQVFYDKKHSTIQEKQLHPKGRFYTLKPFECPVEGCESKCSARSLPVHFEREHKCVPSIAAELFTSCTVLLPGSSLRNTRGGVVAVVALTSGLLTDTTTCWVQCGAVPEKEHTLLVVWVSCVYEAEHMPSILYSVQASTAGGVSTFGGQMTPLLTNKDPRSVMADGKCLVLLMKATERVYNVDKMAVELKFYLG